MFELLPNQHAHVAKLQGILDAYKFAFDFSMLGTGKTYASSWLALQGGFKHVVVVCPLSVAPKWNMMKVEHGLPLACVVSYCSLRSVKDKQPKHGLLNRIDYKRTIKATKKGVEVDTEIDSVRFTLTDKYKAMLAESTMVVIDEIQNFKNMSAQFEACKTLIEGVLKSDTSRVILLSGSPIDKEAQVSRLLKAIDIFRADEIARYNIGLHDMEWTGMQEIVDFCNKVNPDGLRRLPMPRKWAHAGLLHNYAYKLFQTVLKPVLSSSMIPMKIPFTLSKYNGYYQMSPEQEAELGLAVSELESVSGYDKDTGTVHITAVGSKDGSSFAKIQTALVMIERAKRDLFVRLAIDALRTPHTKVVLCFNFASTIDYVQHALREYEPLILDGKTTQKQRGYILDAFQAPNDRYRVLIGNVTVCSTGIDLDDKHGGFPRVAYINPNYSTITLYQLGHRFHRADSKSNARVYFVYGKARPELSVLNALSYKSKIMKETTPEQADAGVVFPVDMPSFVEESENGFDASINAVSQENGVT